MLTAQELEEAVITQPQNKRIGSVVTAITDAVHEDDSLHDAVGQLGVSGNTTLPVFKTDDTDAYMRN